MTTTLQHFTVGVQHLLLPGLAVTTFVALPSILFLRRLSLSPTREAAPLMIALASCGYLIGVIAGNSAIPVAQTVVTGLLGLMAGLVSYVHTRESSKTLGIRTSASIGLISLLIALFLGLILGGAYKKRFESHFSTRDRYNIYFKDYVVPLCLEERKLAATGKSTEHGKTACEALEAGIRDAR